MPALHDPSRRTGDEAAMDLVLAAERRAQSELERASIEAQEILDAAHARSRAIAATAARRIAAARAAIERRLARRLAETSALEREAAAPDPPDPPAHERLERAVARQAARLSGGES